MKVGIAADFYFPWIGGPSTAIRNLASGLVARGHQVAVLAPSPTGSPSIAHEDGIEVTRVATIPAPFGYGLRTALPPRGVHAWLRRTHPDVVQVHHPFPLCAWTVLAARRSHIPAVATNHTIPSCSLRGIKDLPVIYPVAHGALAWWIVSLLSRCDTVATPTATAAALLRQLGYRDHVHVVSNGIDIERFAPGSPSPDLRRRLGIDERPVVLYTGRLDAEKEMHLWLRAADVVCRRHDVQFVVGGEGSDRARLEEMASRLGIRHRTHFVGYVPEADLPDLYRLADLYLIMSPVELQSITTLEAVACGLPVVAVDAGALLELVSDGQNGYLVVDGDWESAAKAVIRMLGDEESRLGMSIRSREIALRHALSHTVDAYERLLQDACARASGDRPVGRLTTAGW